MTMPAQGVNEKRSTTLWRVAAGFLAALLLAGAATAQVTGLYYQEIRKDGTIYVFNTYERYKAFQETGEMGKSAITLTGRGPNGETLIGENATAIDLFLFKNNLPGYDRPTPKPAAPSAAFPNVKISGLAYISYQDGTTGGKDYSQFTLKRGYLDTRRGSPSCSRRAARWTSPRTRPATGSPASSTCMGSSTRLNGFSDHHLRRPRPRRHALARLRGAHQLLPPPGPHVHGVERAPQLGRRRPAGGRNFGGVMSADYKKNVGGAYPGRYGSFQIGVYNGTGYHASEATRTRCWRGGSRSARSLTRSPASSSPTSVSTARATWPRPREPARLDRLRRHGHVRERARTGQAEYFTGKGNQEGKVLNADGSARNQKGYSLFANVRLGEGARWGVIGRYDRFDPNPDGVASGVDDVTKMSIVGLSYTFSGPNVCLLDYQVKKHTDPNIPDEKRVQLTFQVKF